MGRFAGMEALGEREAGTRASRPPLAGPTGRRRAGPQARHHRGARNASGKDGPSTEEAHAPEARILLLSTHARVSLSVYCVPVSRDTGDVSIVGMSWTSLFSASVSLCEKHDSRPLPDFWDCREGKGRCVPTGQGRRTDGSGERCMQASFREPLVWHRASVSLSAKWGGWRYLPWGS